MKNLAYPALAALCLMALASPTHGQVIQRFDPPYDHKSAGDQHQRGDAIWVVYARCTAFHRNADLLVENYREDLAQRRAHALPEHLSMYEFDPEQERVIRESAAARERSYLARGIDVMGQDRPGQNVEAEFRAQVDREFADLQAYPHMPEEAAEMFSNRCGVFSGAISQNALVSGRAQVRGPGIPVSRPLTAELIARIRARDGY